MQDRAPVLLLHGIWKSGAAFATLARRLRAAGFTTHAVDLKPNDGSAPLADLAALALAEADRVFGAGARFDLVGFSMGGLVARYLVQRLLQPGLTRVKRLVTLGTPHHGTLTAELSSKRGAVEMRRGSAWLTDLARDVDTLGAIDVTSVWTPLDLMILPSDSSRLPVGRELLVASPLHALLLRDPRALDATLRALEAPLGTRTGPRRPADDRG